MTHDELDFSKMIPIAIYGEFGVKVLRPDLLTDEVCEECEASNDTR